MRVLVLYLALMTSVGCPADLGTLITDENRYRIVAKWPADFGENNASGTLLRLSYRGSASLDDFPICVRPLLLLSSPLVGLINGDFWYFQPAAGQGHFLSPEQVGPALTFFLDHPRVFFNLADLRIGIPARLTGFRIEPGLPDPGASFPIYRVRGLYERHRESARAYEVSQISEALFQTSPHNSPR